MGSRAAPMGAVSPSPPCPFCGATMAERVGQWGGQIITSQWRCGRCGSYFEALREDFDDAPPATPSPSSRAGAARY
jgi:ribosomal protein S27AE